MKMLVLVGIVLALLFASFNFFSLRSITCLTGVVTAISQDSMTVTSDVPNPVAIAVLSSTLFFQDGKSVPRRELRIGTRVDVYVESTGKELRAIQVSFETQPVRRNAPTGRRLALAGFYRDFTATPLVYAAS